MRLFQKIMHLPLRLLEQAFDSLGRFLLVLLMPLAIIPVIDYILPTENVPLKGILILPTDLIAILLLLVCIEAIKGIVRQRAVAKLAFSKPPGTRLLTFVDFLFSPKTVEQTFKPLIADWRYEYFEALKQGRKWKARWISVRYRYSFIMAMSLSKVFSLLKQIRSVSK